jgi:hypothetical protein
LKHNLFMSKANRIESRMRVILGHASRVIVCLFAAVFALATAALGQGTSEFNLQPSALSPSAVAPGGVSSTTIQLTPALNSGFTGTVALTCQVTASIATTDTPLCTLSPTALAVPGTSIATITTKPTTTQTLYSITITGTGPTTTYTSPALDFTVLSVTPQFTITVQSSVAPTSVPAGSGGQGVVSINPSNGYSTGTGTNDGITLACGSISPLVAIAPVCSFNPNGKDLQIHGGQAALSTLNVSTFGPVVTGARVHPGMFYALWLPIPLLVTIGAATGGKRARKAWGLIALFVVSAFLLLLPACGNTTNTTSTPNGITPANTYTFTIVGVDENGVVSSNVSATNTGPTVSLTVTTPPKQ